MEWTSGRWCCISGGRCVARRSGNSAACGQIDSSAARFGDFHERVGQVVDVAIVASCTEVKVLAYSALVPNTREELPSTTIAMTLMFIVLGLRVWRRS